jgi:hypothetical protein
MDLSLDSVAIAAEWACTSSASEQVNHPETYHIANLLDDLIYEHANTRQILLKFRLLVEFGDGTFGESRA